MSEARAVPLLQATGLRVSFGAVQAVKDVDLSLAAGTVTGLIGPNGAGKTTFIDALMGFVPTDAGEVHLDGRPLTGLPPHRRAALGLARTFQSLELFDDLTVEENLLVAAESPGSRLDAQTSVRRAAELVDLGSDRARVAAHLPPGKRKALALGRALASNPRLLLLDEPAAGLDPDERHGLMELVRRIAASGTGVLLVDHDLGLVLDVCERVVVLDLGEVVFDGGPQAARADVRVAAAYLGAGEAHPAPTPRPAGEGAVVEVRGLSAGYGEAPVLHDVDLRVGAGEIVALLGPNGAGKTTMLLTLSGVVPPLRGEVRVLGAPLDRRPQRIARRGVAQVLQERKVFGGLSAAENLRLADRTGRGVREALELFPALTPLLGKPAGALSGGEQQLLALARAVARSPRLLLVDELSLGLAPAAVDRLLDALAAICDRSGTSILFAEQHARHALRVAHRAYVLAAGRVVLEAPSAELVAHPERLTAAYLGQAPPTT